MVAAKSFIFILLLVFSFTTFAEPPVYSGKVEDAKTGRIDYTVVNVGEPAIVPYRLTLSLRCRGQKAGDTLKSEMICDFRKPEFNEKTKVLTIHYSTSQTRLGQSKCDSDWAQDFDLKLLCP